MADILGATKKGIARRRVSLELLAARFQVAETLRVQCWLEANAYFYGWLHENGAALGEEQALVMRQFETFSGRLDEHRSQTLRAVETLHRHVVQAATLHLDNDAVQSQCEAILQLSLPSCDPPGPDVDSAEKIGQWLHDATLQGTKAIRETFLGQLDALITLLTKEATMLRPPLN